MKPQENPATPSAISPPRKILPKKATPDTKVQRILKPVRNATSTPHQGPVRLVMPRRESQTSTATTSTLNKLKATTKRAIPAKLQKLFQMTTRSRKRGGGKSFAVSLADIQNVLKYGMGELPTIPEEDETGSQNPPTKQQGCGNPQNRQDLTITSAEEEPIRDWNKQATTPRVVPTLKNDNPGKNPGFHIEQPVHNPTIRWHWTEMPTNLTDIPNQDIIVKLTTKEKFTKFSTTRKDKMIAPIQEHLK